jgi:hypothetical protein
MDARLDTSSDLLKIAHEVIGALLPLEQHQRARVLLLVILDVGPGVVSDEALLRLCHAAQAPVPARPHDRDAAVERALRKQKP